MTDPIRAAWKEAAEAARAALTHDEACPDSVCPSLPCQCVSDATAATIAAFLRALPPGMIRWGTDASGYDTHNKPTLRRLAAAVEAAAKEDRE
jgi:hypothetical protein